MKKLIYLVLFCTFFLIGFYGTSTILGKKDNVMLLNETNFYEEVKDGVVVLDFYADWCGPCKALAPTLDKVENAKVGKINIDGNSNLATSYNVQSIPLLVFMKDGEEKSRMVGLQSLKTIQDKVDELNGL